MKTEIHDKFKITCTPENKRELIDLLDILRIEPTTLVDAVPVINPDYMAALNGEVTSFELTAHRSSTEGGGGWMRNTVTTPFLQPYWARLKKHFGADPFDLDLTPACHICTHTHIVERLWHGKGSTFYTSVFELFPRQGETLNPDQVLSHAVKEAGEDVAGILGKLRCDPEYIQGPYGSMTLNKHRFIGPTMVPGSDKIWELMVDTWLERFGTVGQKLTIATRAYRGHRGDTHWDHLSSSYGEHTGLHLDNCNVSMTWEEFQQL
jgi:hypothetical protein